MCHVNMYLAFKGQTSLIEAVLAVLEFITYSHIQGLLK